MDEYLQGCTGVVVKKDNYILLGERCDDQGWSLAGGKQEKNETLEGCAKRELKEEFGIDSLELKYLGKVYSKAMVKGVERKVSPTIYLCERFKGEINIDLREFKNYKWVHINDVLNIRNLFLPSKEGIKLLINGDREKI
ncbi:MAG: NUDIX domain-containing protein [Anaeromicrobium sp.]|nr:NUDIX domain-containing protein [Anaeromicrobium sp.]